MILFGFKIKQLRKENRYTQAELANLLGVTKSTVASYENNSRQPSYDVLIKLAEVFHVSVDSILLNRSNHILEVDHLTDDQIKIIHTIIDAFQKSNLLNETASMDPNTMIDFIKKFKTLAERSTGKIEK